MIKEDFCFVMMPFSNELSGVYFDAIKPAVENKGLKCIRVDEDEQPGSVIKRIIENIRRAKVIIADLTDRNPNVFFELGIANSLGNNTIVIAQDIHEVPFDVQGYQVIVYENTISGGAKLRRQLEKKIASVEEWSLRPNNPVWDFLPERIISEGQYKQVLDELQDAKGKLQSSQRHLEAYEEMKLEHQEMKQQFNGLSDKAKELDLLQKWLGLLFMGPGSAPQDGPPDFMSRVREVVEQVQKEGQVSIDVASTQNDGKKKKIIFTKIQ
ncbi:hypothetical protein Q4E93_20940 [Flavitalea sp. BT771]|uniref:hypothetical protein n=1 Tax=Flavitalea sp. BT771 TaxID=3063329 RepID=UPI0026E23ACA|nr:hypothetical protein [Flavitalea sp. BT771]MDO6433088.1 hypothetical protein [Flavitalea sp. BT771]MDV6221636.1 hypothetical protein [Flavitalea sp. BT771]